jgi:transcriptional regulator with XRE-family HTH domain
MDSLIRRKRKEIGIPLSVVARKLGVSRQTLTSWEKKDTAPAMNKIETLSAILNLKFVDVAKDYINKEEVE